MEKEKNENALLFCWVVALAATAGSLYFSEIKGYLPCELCWFQRILMYPLIIVYGVALWKKQLNIALPGAILSGIGMFVSAYHYLIQKLPALHETGSSCGLIPCNTEYINIAGFITIPFLAGAAFILIFATHLTLLVKNRRHDK
ncbi:disulfide oxidoreductase [Virgibacillus sp. 179-BFC.A HS]|uniref:Probable disulfide formation protein n=1 Tax=Tigheibacillus jepli TaxID=3035914 RepID=A0ABU5CK51_9BACI|nr:disulfide oxidoreductase [Virgibacillus sp. 179-BFC.A HS]MDY0406227.1 disulfide oxidoreductase [Virgibacillus sp. 179-BFC.A HS]